MQRHLERVEHTLAPVFDGHSRALILGSIPSPKSRESGFYYGHPQNRFWRVLAAVFGQETPCGNENKKAFVLRNGVALWDVLARCDIEGASDSSIKNPTPHNLRQILDAAPIQAILTTGGTANRLYCRFCEPISQIHAISLPSTSPANCACSFESLVQAYGVLLTLCGRP